MQHVVETGQTNKIFTHPTWEQKKCWTMLDEMFDTASNMFQHHPTCWVVIKHGGQTIKCWFTQHVGSSNIYRLAELVHFLQCFSDLSSLLALPLFSDWRNRFLIQYLCICILPPSWIFRLAWGQEVTPVRFHVTKAKSLVLENCDHRNQVCPFISSSEHRFSTQNRNRGKCARLLTGYKRGTKL